MREYLNWQSFLDFAFSLGDQWPSLWSYMRFPVMTCPAGKLSSDYFKLFCHCQGHAVINQYKPSESYIAYNLKVHQRVSLLLWTGLGMASCNLSCRCCRMFLAVVALVVLMKCVFCCLLLFGSFAKGNYGWIIPFEQVKHPKAVEQEVRQGKLRSKAPFSY